MVDVAFAKKLNAFRRQLLKTTQTTYVPVTGVYKDWFLCHGGVLAMWPAWFGGPHPDWPKTVAQLGFPGEGGGKKTVSTEASSPSTTQVTRFLDSAVRDETRVWVFMVSSGNPPHSASFFKAAVCAAAKAGVHAVLLTKAAKGTPCVSQIQRLFDHTVLTLFWQNAKEKRPETKTTQSFFPSANENDSRSSL